MFPSSSFCDGERVDGADELVLPVLVQLGDDLAGEVRFGNPITIICTGPKDVFLTLPYRPEDLLLLRVELGLGEHPPRPEVSSGSRAG